MRIKRNTFVWFFYYTTFTILLLDTTDNVPMTNILRLIKYAFLAFVIFENVFIIGISGKLYIVPTVFMGLILLHTVMFGRIWINPYVYAETLDHFKQLMIVFGISFLSGRYCFWSKSRKEFLISTFFSFATFLGWCYVTHLNGFAPFRYMFRIVSIFQGEDRYGFTFGMSHYSLTGNFAATAIFFTILFWQYRNEFGGLLGKYKEFLFWVGLLGFSMILVSSCSRGEIMSTIIFFLMLMGLNIKHKINGKLIDFIINAILLIIVIVAIYCVIAMTFDEQSISNRNNNFWVNYNIFKEIGQWYKGMGYIEQHGFLNQSFGYGTWACDVYYLYIFFSTGIIGSAILGAAIIIMALTVYFGKTATYVKYDNCIKSILTAILFDNLYHCTLVSYIYLSSIPILILFVEYLYSAERFYSIKIQVKGK